MSHFVDRLERELLAAGRRSRLHRVARRASAKAVPVVLSVAAAAVIVAAGLTRRSSHAPTGAAPHPPPHFVHPIVSTAPACRLINNGPVGLPPLIESHASPSGSLLSLLGLLRQPATAADQVSLRGFNRWPQGVLAVYTRYTRVVQGSNGARIAILPARICEDIMFTRASRQPAGRIVLAPHDALLMQVLSNPPTRPTVEMGTATDIRNGQANPGLGNTAPRGSWLQTTVVPDGVARVVFQFTPPFRHRYTVTLPIHNNVGIASPLPPHWPTITTWYAANGQVIRTFTAWRMLRYGNCIARHAKNCGL
jgi:hypothetical protein